MTAEIKGQIHSIGEIQTFPSGFSKRDLVLVLDPNGKYPQYRNIVFKKDDCDLLDKWKIGDEVEIVYNLNGKEYNGKYYNEDSFWKFKSEPKHDNYNPPSTVSMVNDPEPENDLPY